MSTKIGVLGSGSFGTAISRLLGKNNEVLIYTRRDAILKSINEDKTLKGYKLPNSVSATMSLEEIGRECKLIFPVIPSQYLREVMKDISPFLDPSHIMIHGTKGLDITPAFESAETLQEIKKTVFTMSEVIQQETSVIRIGALAGPNLSKEILDGQPAATVIASLFDEVIEMGIRALASKQFIIFGSHNLKGIELAGALKNTIAIASGLMNGIGFGKNVQALLITRGLREMIHIAISVGAELRPFLGTAGIGDLIATATSTNSRNYTFGRYLAEGKTIEEIGALMDEVAEGYRTVKFAYKTVIAADIDAPMTKTLYSVIYEDKPIKNALIDLIQNPLSVDVDFL